MNFENDVPKYKKKKKSSTSKSETKSKHKHEYIDCLFVGENIRPHKGQYCRVCGRITNKILIETVKSTVASCRLLNSREVYEKYKDLEKVRVEDYSQKYINIERE